MFVIDIDKTIALIKAMIKRWSIGKCLKRCVSPFFRKLHFKFFPHIVGHLGGEASVGRWWVVVSTAILTMVIWRLRSPVWSMMHCNKLNPQQVYDGRPYKRVFAASTTWRLSQPCAIDYVTWSLLLAQAEDRGSAEWCVDVAYISEDITRWAGLLEVGVFWNDSEYIFWLALDAVCTRNKTIHP